VKFFTYQCLIVSLLFILVACSKTNQLQHVNQMMQDITSSQDVLYEEKNIQILKNYSANKGIVLAITSLDSENEDINALTDLTSIKSLRIVFNYGEASKEFLWQPININNVFIPITITN